jgi:hypothetical protein
MLTLEGAMSWKDSRDKGDRIRQAMRMRAAEGKPMGPVRIGYRSVFRPDGAKVLEVVPEVARHVRRLFTLAAAACSIQELFAEAQRLGLRARSGKVLHRSAIHALLRDPLYKGCIRFDGVVAKGRHEPIVDDVLWQRVQKALAARCTSVPRTRDFNLRDLFIFGDLLKCPKCGRTLRPYRAKGKYVYYECKNPDTSCGVLLPQPTLVKQLPALVNGITLDAAELDVLRRQLLSGYRENSGEEIARRRTAEAAYEAVVKEIGDMFAQRKEAEALGIVDVIDRRLAALKARKDELQASLKECHDQSMAWVEAVTRSFELFELLREAIFSGSAQDRGMVLRGIASNYTVRGETLVPELRSPFREHMNAHGRPEWYTGLLKRRTEVIETFGLLQAAHASFSAPLLWQGQTTKL